MRHSNEKYSDLKQEVAKKYCFFIFFCSIILVISNQVTGTNAAEIVTTSKKQEVYIQQQSDESKYVAMLERINSQLALAWTPFNTILTVLTALITAGGIFAAVIIYRQSREYGQQLTKERNEFIKRVEDFFAERNRLAQEIDDRGRRIIEQYEKGVEELIKSTPEKQVEEVAKIKKDLEKLQTERSTVASQNVAYGSRAIAEMGIGTNIHRCSQCGFGMKVVGLPMQFGQSTISRVSVVGVLERYSVTCQRCGNVDEI